MTVTLELSEEVEAFVRGEVAGGAAASEAAFLAKAVEMYRELKVRHKELQVRVHESIGEYERGDLRELDTDATKAEARRRFFQNQDQ